MSSPGAAGLAQGSRQAVARVTVAGTDHREVDGEHEHGTAHGRARAIRSAA